MVKYTSLPDNKDKPFGGAYSVYDPETVYMRDYLVQKYAVNNFNFESLKQEYFSVFKDFLSTPHKLIDIEKYKHFCFTQGTTESFSHFYIRFNNKRLRLARGDALVISAPFSDTCDIYPNLENILSECDNKNIPVLLDLAYINLATNIEIDLTHSCIEYIVSSLSKVFPVENYRIGIRLQKTMFEDPLYVINEVNYNYINMLSVYLGTEMMKHFEPDYIFNKYRQKQLDFCKRLNVEPTSCVYFGLDKNNNYPEYNRGRNYNRLCFSRIWDGRMQYEL